VASGAWCEKTKVRFQYHKRHARPETISVQLHFHYSSRSNVSTPTAARPGKNKLDEIVLVKVKLLPLSL
jgi:hypothetical protein